MVPMSIDEQRVRVLAEESKRAAQREVSRFFHENQATIPASDVNWEEAAARHAFAGGTPRLGALTPAFAQWLGQPKSIPGSDPGGRNSSLWWYSRSKDSAAQHSKATAAERAPCVHRQFVMGSLSRTSADAPSAARVSAWRQSHVAETGRVKRRPKGIVNTPGLECLTPPHPFVM